MESWTTWYTCGATLHRIGHAKESSNCNAAGDPDSSRKQVGVQRDFRRKYPEYECYIAAGSDIDIVADTGGDQVPSDGYNGGRAHITVVTFLHKRVFCPKALVVTRNWYKPRDKKASSNRQQQEGRTFKDVLILTFRQK